MTAAAPASAVARGVHYDHSVATTTERRDPEGAIEALEAQLASTPRGARPYEHAALAYRLGMAYAESPSGSREQQLRKALAAFDVAAAIFDPRFDPAEHARVLNGAGAVHRALGDRRKAVSLFTKAADLFDGQDRPDELAGALSNVGLVRTELGEADAAVEAFDRALPLYDTSSGNGRRGRLATLLNRGQAHAAQGTVEGLEAALADYETADAEIDFDEAPYHFGLLQHSVGVACNTLAGLKADERARLFEEAVTAFRECLTVFNRQDFPYQHALAKHNLGLAYAGLGDDMPLRRALAAFEDSVGMLDPRLHADAWKQAFASLTRIEEQLAERFPGVGRAAHFAAVLASEEDEARYSLLRERLYRLLDLPEPRRRSAMAELDLAIAQLPPSRAEAVIATELNIIIEMPIDKQEPSLRARFDAHQQLEGEAREAADRVLDAAIGWAIEGPQRIQVRDFFYSLGWERP